LLGSFVKSIELDLWAWGNWLGTPCSRSWFIVAVFNIVFRVLFYHWMFRNGNKVSSELLWDFITEWGLFVVRNV
jgi:hypothetical protein